MWNFKGTFVDSLRALGFTSSYAFLTAVAYITTCLVCRHNGLDGVSNHQPHDCLHSLLFRCRSKKTPMLRVAGLCAGNLPLTGEFPAQMASNAENVSIWWRHHGKQPVVGHVPTLLDCYTVLVQDCQWVKRYGIWYHACDWLVWKRVDWEITELH